MGPFFSNSKQNLTKNHAVIKRLEADSLLAIVAIDPGRNPLKRQWQDEGVRGGGGEGSSMAVLGSATNKVYWLETDG